MLFVITGLSRAWRIKSDITVLVLSYCDSIKLMIIYDLMLANCLFFKETFYLQLFTSLFGIYTKKVK